MKKSLSWLLVAGLVMTFGCAKEPDPTKRPDFVDTSDPSKLKMAPLPNQAPPGGGGMGAGAGAGPPPGGAGS